jgi:hypothetical protein
VRRLQLILTVFCGCFLLAVAARADTYRLNDGNILTGDIVSFNDNGAIVRQTDGSYSERAPWSNFSQADLRELSKNEKMAPFVEPFVEPVLQPRAKLAPVQIKDWPHLQRAKPGSLLGAMFSSSVGILTMLLIYGANIYAGFEISIFRIRPTAVVCGLAAIPFVGFISNIAFLAMPAPPVEKAVKEEAIQPVMTGASPLVMPTVEPVAGAAAGAAPAGQSASGGLKLAHETPSQTEGGATAPEPQIFQRGAFTFNRRFFETKFSGFFGVIRRDSEENMVLVFKSMRGTYTAQRITRISSADLHLEVHKGHASEEIALPFSEIQEVQLRAQEQT